MKAAFYILGSGALLAGIAALYFNLLYTQQKAPPPIPPVAPITYSEHAVQSSPAATEGTSAFANLEMAAFRKAILFIESYQEPEGNWRPDKTGADATFNHSNAGISLTALATMTISAAIQGRSPNAEDVAAARQGAHWLVGMQHADGRIVNLSLPDSVEAQLLAALALMRAGELSGRRQLDDAARSAVVYVFQNMMAARGGFGSSPHAESSRADLTALGALVFQTAAANEFHFGGKLDIEAERGLKAGLPDAPSDFASAVAAISAKVMLLASAQDLQPTIDFLMRDYDGRGKRFASMNWGKVGGGYNALTLWQGSMAFRQLYGEDTLEWNVWNEQIHSILLENQAANGSWPVAGPDGHRGQVWRTCFSALCLLMTQPSLPQVPQSQRAK